MKPIDQSNETDLDARYRTMLALWFGLFMSIGLYFAVSLFMAPQISNPSETAPNTLLAVVFTALGALFVLLSFVVKRKLLHLSVERQEVALVQKALIIACAMCEVSALLGLVERFLFDSNEYYLLFLVAALGTALHFPKREQLVVAT